jgi:hypothetical protein
MQKAAGTLLLHAEAPAVAMESPVPEVNVGSAGSAIALLSGALLMIRGPRRK